MIIEILITLFIIYEIYDKLIKPIIIISKLKLDNFIFISGGVKTGKSTLAIYFAIIIIQYKRRIVKIQNIFRKKGNKKKLPLLYGNIPIDVWDNGIIEGFKNLFRKKEKKVYKSIFAPLTKDILLRKKKPIEKSVLYMGEFSLIADSMNWQDAILNEQILLFFKLFGHEFNGTIIAESQNIEDVHFAIKRITNKYIWIYRAKKGIRYYNMNVKEIVYNYQNNAVVNNINKANLEEETLLIKVPKSIWKRFDYRAYSILTDHLPEEETTTKPVTLKQNYIISFNKWKTMSLFREQKEGGQKEDAKQTK